MAHRTLYVAQIGPPAFPRFVIYDTKGHAWDGSSWCGRPFLYADQHTVSTDCFDLQRNEVAGKKCHVVVEVPLRIEAFSDDSLDLEQLRDWLYQHVSLGIDISSGSGPTQDSIILGSIEWPRFGRPGEAT